jgi:hypothetical protein
VIHDELPPDARLFALEDMTTMHYHKLIERSRWQKPFRRVRSFRRNGERYDWLRRETRALSIAAARLSGDETGWVPGGGCAR